MTSAISSGCNNLFIGVRGLDPDRAKAAALLGQIRNYPYSQREQPQAVSRHIAAAGRKWSGTQPSGLAYWALLARMVNEEPALERDRITLGGLVPLAPYMLIPHVSEALQMSAFVSLIALIAFGAFKGYFTGQKMWVSALQTATIGSLAAFAAYTIAKWIA